MAASKNLQVSRINPQDETERYRQHVLETKGRILMRPESGCSKRIYVLLAQKRLRCSGVSRVIREAGKRFVVMDTAPTGHTLLLLDATGAYHREIAKKMGIKFILPL